MNQILLPNNNNDENSGVLQKNFAFRKSIFFKFQFVICSIIAIGTLLYYGYNLYNNNRQEKLSEKLANNFTITNLYNSNSGYNANLVSTNNDYIKNNNKFSVIGLIEINSIGINYPILSTINEELLKIAPCKFYGPMPNEVGNLCIAGHNYNNYKFFSRLKKLNIGDTINIYDLTGTKIEYTIYNTYETDSNDLSCISQNTNGKKEITLITCNNIKNRRRVIKAYQKAQ